MPSGRRAVLIAVLVVASASVAGVATFPPSTAETDPATSTAGTDTATLASTDFPPQASVPQVEPRSVQAQEANESLCSFDHPSWRAPQLLAGVRIQGEQVCRPDDPNVVAASVLGTNNVPDVILERSGLSRDAVVKHTDRDGDGDPDVVEVTLEVMGVNEQNAALNSEIAPGVSPAFWVFAPKTRGMVTDASAAGRLVRMPSPPIRVEAGDTVRITVENTHYLPHTFQVSGATPRPAANGNGSGAVPDLSDQPVVPGEQRTYEFTPEQPGTYVYHGDGGPGVQDRMGMSGLFVVTENRSDNSVQTLNVGGGKVRHPSAAMQAEHAAVFDIQYQGIDATLHEIPKRYDDVRRVAAATNREYDPTNASMDYFLLNGRSFPYTLRESLLPVQRNETYRLRVLNAGSTTVSLHAHGHALSVDQSGAAGPPNATGQPRDVLALAAGQRADVVLNTTTDGVHSAGAGVWRLHDHQGAASTTDGIAPGGSVSMIAYEPHLAPNGVPETEANLSRYFDAAYYEGAVPVWGHLDEDAFGAPPDDSQPADSTPPGDDAGVRRTSGVSDLVLFGVSVLAGALVAGFGVALGRWSR